LESDSWFLSSWLLVQHGAGRWRFLLLDSFPHSYSQMLEIYAIRITLRLKVLFFVDGFFAFPESAGLSPITSVHHALNETQAYSSALPQPPHASLDMRLVHRHRNLHWNCSFSVLPLLSANVTPAIRDLAISASRWPRNLRKCAFKRELSRSGLALSRSL
jgi:hypothetical protein